MSLHLTPQILEAAYELLRATPPFTRWRLPHADDVEFHVTREVGTLGTYDHDKKRGVRRITVSSNNISQLSTLIPIMAHEMVHLVQDLQGRLSEGGHNAHFRKLARMVCVKHGFDQRFF